MLCYGLISLCLVGLQAVRVPTTWQNYNTNARPPSGTQFSVKTNYNQVNSWHNNPKNHHSRSNIFVPYFPAAAGQGKESFNNKVTKRFEAVSSFGPHQAVTRQNKFYNRKPIPRPIKSYYEAPPKPVKVVTQYIPPRYYQKSYNVLPEKQPTIHLERGFLPSQHFAPTIQNQPPKTHTVQTLKPEKQKYETFEPTSTGNFYPPANFETKNFQSFGAPPRKVAYPGEGVWAKPIPRQSYINPPNPPKIPETEETQPDSDDDSPSDGHEIFQENQQVFNKQLEQFYDKTKNLNEKIYKSKLPNKNPTPINTRDEIQEESEDDYVPVRTYSQVRKYEDEQHLPASVLEPRLSELVKDSKIHTVYTEEGYEDTAYDHAGHEKNAEDSEGYVEKDDGKDSAAEGSEPIVKKTKSRVVQTNMKVKLKPEKVVPLNEREKKISIGIQGDASEAVVKRTRGISGNVQTKVEHKEVVNPIQVVDKEIKPNIVENSVVKSQNVENEEARNRTRNFVRRRRIKSKPTSTTEAYEKKAMVVDTENIKLPDRKPRMKISLRNYRARKLSTTTSLPEPSSEEISTKIKLNIKPKENETVNFAQLGEIENKSQIDHDTAKSIKQDIERHFKDETKTRRKRFVQTEKYPYYYSTNLPKNSPLRYGQNINTVPIKREGEMSFYNHMNNIECQEVETNVNPIPEGVEEGEKAGGDPKLPRLQKLGDKIDCFKAKYFGENPLDSPIFNEEVIEAPDPIFKELKRSHSKRFVNEVGNRITELNAIETSSFKEFVKPDGVLNARENNFIDSNENGETVNREIGLNEIYNKLKANFEIENVKDRNQEQSDNKDKNVEKVDNVRDININESIGKTFKSARKPKVSDVILDFQNATNADYEYEDYDVEEPVHSSDSNSPQALPVRMIHKRRRKIPKRREQFRRTKYVPRYSPRYPPRMQPINSKPPRPQILSEVHYKDEIKPNEQLNVFADIINNIKNSTFDSIANPSEPINIPIPFTRTHAREKSNIVPATTIRTVYRKRKIPIHKVNEQVYDEYLRNLKKQQVGDDSKIDSFYQPNRVLRKKKRRPEDSHSIKATTYYEEFADSTPETTEIEQFKVIRPTATYTTIDIPMNTYYVQGMKPPLEHERPYIYADYKMLQLNALRRNGIYSNHRMKRSTSRLSYSTISRPQAPKAEEEKVEEEAEEDEYVPHRPKNYYYDPESDSIVYNNKKEEESKEMFVEVEYEDEEIITKKPVTTTTHRTVYHKDVLNKENGPTLIDFLARLKTDPSYKIILDPETTEKTTTTTIAPDKTTPPEFLQFLKKLHTNKEYVKIEDEDEDKKKKEKATTTTTTEAPVVEEEEEVEEELENVQNSPGGQFNSGGQFQIFDINDYLPKTKNYSPRTTIDYSKYKTIERVSTRHSMSSRYSDEDEDEDLPTSRKTERTQESADSGYEETEEETSMELKQETTTTTTTTTEPTTVSTTARRIRNRKRPTTTQKPTTSTPIRSTTQATEIKVYTPATHRPASRVYRRQRPKIRLRTTTAATPSIEEEAEEGDVQEHKPRLERKLDDDAIKVPANHKALYTPITVEDRIDTNPIIFKRPRLVTPDIIQYNKTDLRSNNKGEINPRKLVEVFKDYDKSKRHGGNYIRQNDKVAGNGSESVDNPTRIDLFQSGSANENGVNKGKIVVEGGREIKNSDYDYEDEVKIYFKKDGKTTAIIKDPSKRLYFYAPV